ncbi:hypothetical protein FBU30_005682 [Linnemannia zychae]|nr:hypothetical protein FBU30_005682 [Linnemannia zychae]
MLPTPHQGTSFTPDQRIVSSMPTLLNKNNNISSSSNSSSNFNTNQSQSGTATTKQPIFITPDGKSLHIGVPKTLPNREDIVKKIEDYGGTPTLNKNEAIITLGIPGRKTQEPKISTQWMYDCIMAGSLINHDTAAYRLEMAPRNEKAIFTVEDDRLLREYVKAKIAANAFTSGNKIYEEFAALHKKHTAQSWRHRALKVLMLTTEQSPYGANKAIREEARRKQQQKLASDSLLLEAVQQKILESRQLLQQHHDQHHDQQRLQQEQRQQQQQQEQYQKLIQSPSKTEATSIQNATQLSSISAVQIIESDSEVELKQEPLQHHMQLFSQPQSSQDPVLIFSDIESTDEEDRFHKAEMDIIARRHDPNSQMSASQLSASPSKHKIISDQMRNLNSESLSSSQQTPPGKRRSHSPDINHGHQQDHDDTNVVTSVNDDNPFKSPTVEDPELDKPLIEKDKRTSFSENHDSHSNPIICASSPNNTTKTNGKNNSNKNSLPVEDDSSIDDKSINGQRNNFTGTSSDSDNGDYEPRRFHSSSRSRQTLKTRNRRATLSPVSKRVESTETQQDALTKRRTRKSLPNRSWNTTTSATSKSTAIKVSSQINDEDIIYRNRRGSAGVPTKDDLVSIQDPLMSSSSLPSWRNSPQAHLSIPNTFSEPVIHSPTSSQPDAISQFQLTNVTDDSQELVVESAQNEVAGEDLHDDHTNSEPQDVPIIDNYQDKSGAEDELDTTAPHQENMSEQEQKSDLTDEDDIAIEQRILAKTLAQQRPSSDSNEQSSSSPNTTPTIDDATLKAQEAHDSKVDHLTCELPAKLFSHTPTLRHHRQCSQTIWSTGMSFQVKMLPVVDPMRGRRSMSVANPDHTPRDFTGPTSRAVSVPATTEEVSLEYIVNNRPSILHENQGELQTSRTTRLKSRKVGISTQVEGTESQTIVGTEVIDTVEESINDAADVSPSAEDLADGGDIEEAVFENGPVEGYNEEQGDDDDEAVQLQNSSVQKVLAEAAVSLPIKSRSRQATKETSVSSIVPEPKDVVLDYYSREGEKETLEMRQEREQLLLYLRDLYRKEIRTLMLHELVPALRSIDILDACNGDLALARVLVNKGMTKQIESGFWTREDDCRLFSNKNDTVASLLTRHSPVQLIQRTKYLTKTREEAKKFEIAPDAMEKSGLLKRSRGRFGSRNLTKKIRIGGDDG